MQTETQPAKFTDRTGREWTLALDFALLRKVKLKHKLDLGAAERIAHVWATLLYDDLLALELVWTVIAAAAEADQVTQDAYVEAMDGPTLGAALDALGGALLNFTQPRKRGMTETAIRNVTDGMRRAIKQAETLIETTIETSTLKALETLGGSPTTSPASSDTSTTAGA
jgi:hypothetical protein